MKKLLILFFLLMILFNAATLKASGVIDFENVEEMTYRFYLAQKWDSVIYIGKQALRNNIDYYYLRVRMGLAYYEKKSYIPAANHLIKAREFDPTDPVIAEYLYYAFVFTNRTEEARILQSSLADTDKKSSRPKPPLVDAVNLESGYTFSSNTKMEEKPFLMENDSIYGETDLYGDYLYEHLGVKFNLSDRVGLSAGYNYLNFSKNKYIQYSRFEDHLEGIADSSWGKYYLYSFPRVTYDTNFKYQISQHEFHASLSWYLNKGFRIMPAIHMIHASYPLIEASYSIDTVYDTLYYLNSSQTYYTFPFKRTNYSYTQTDTSFTNWLVGLMVSKELGRVNLGVSGSWSNLNNRTQIQVGAVFTWFPFGNLNLYGTTTIAGFFQKSDKRLLLSQVVGAKITPWCWAEGAFYYGDYTNANILNGAVIYNNSDVIDYRGSANIYFLVGKHLQLSLIYQYARKESKQYFFTGNEQSGVSSKPKVLLNPYNTNTIIGGITWKL